MKTLALTPARKVFRILRRDSVRSPRRGRVVRRSFRKPNRGDCREIIEQTCDCEWLFPLPEGEGQGEGKAIFAP